MLHESKLVAVLNFPSSSNSGEVRAFSKFRERVTRSVIFWLSIMEDWLTRYPRSWHNDMTVFLTLHILYTSASSSMMNLGKCDNHNFGYFRVKWNFGNFRLFVVCTTLVVCCFCFRMPMGFKNSKHHFINLQDLIASQNNFTYYFPYIFQSLCEIKTF